MNWYYLKNGQCVGPVPAADIIRLVREGRLLRHDRVRHDEYGPWLRVAQVPTLRPVARSMSATSPTGLGQYLRAHWQGRLPLAQSFWFNAFLPLLLISAGFFAAVHARLPDLAEGFSSKHFALLLAGLALLLMPWQFIGAWRAAEQRIGHGEDLAASAACFGLAAVVAQLFGLFAWSVPAFLPESPAMARAAVVAAPAAGAPAVPKPVTVAPAKPAMAPVAAPTPLERLATIEPFATLRAEAPGEYRTVQAAVERAQRAGAGEEAALAQAAGMIQPLAERYMPLAPDAALSAYVGVLLRELQALQAKDAALCAAFAYPREREAVRLAEHVDPALLRAERVALTEVIRAAALQPQARADFADVKQDLVGVYRRVAERHGSAVYRLDKPYETGFDDRQLCQVTIDVYAEFQKLPPTARGRVLRFTLGS